MIFDYYKINKSNKTEVFIKNICFDFLNDFHINLKRFHCNMTIITDLFLSVKLDIFNGSNLVTTIFIKEIYNDDHKVKFEANLTTKKVNIILEDNSYIKPTLITKELKSIHKNKISFYHKNNIHTFIGLILSYSFENKNPFMTWLNLLDINLNNTEIKENVFYLYDECSTYGISLTKNDLIKSVIKDSLQLSLNFVNLIKKHNIEDYIETIINHINLDKQNKEVLNVLFDTKNTEYLIKKLINSRTQREEKEFYQFESYLKYREEKKQLFNFKELHQIISYLKGSIDRLTVDRYYSWYNIINSSCDNIIKNNSLECYIEDLEYKIKQNIVISEVESTNLLDTLEYLFKKDYLFKYSIDRKHFIHKILNIIDYTKTELFASFEKYILTSEYEKLFDCKEQILLFHIKNKLKFGFNLILIEKILNNIDLEVKYQLIDIIDEKSLWIHKDYISKIKQQYELKKEIENF